jgi:hypothetical protein
MNRAEKIRRFCQPFAADLVKQTVSVDRRYFLLGRFGFGETFAFCAKAAFVKARTTKTRMNE